MQTPEVPVSETPMTETSLSKVQMPEKGFCRYQEDGQYVCNNQTGKWIGGQHKTLCNDHAPVSRGSNDKDSCVFEKGNYKCSSATFKDNLCKEHFYRKKRSFHNDVDPEMKISEFCGYRERVHIKELNVYTMMGCCAKTGGGMCAIHQVIIQGKRNMRVQEARAYDEDTKSKKKPQNKAPRKFKKKQLSNSNSMPVEPIDD